EPVRDGEGEARVGADPVGEPAVVSAGADGRLLQAEVLLAAATPVAFVAGGALPADADALADVEHGARPGGHHRTDDLVAPDERIAARRPVVVREGPGAVAGPAAAAPQVHNLPAP